MKLLVKVRVNLPSIGEFGKALASGGLDRSCVRGETVCLKDDPAVGFSVWEVGDMEEFERKFAAWRRFYSDVDIQQVISPLESMKILVGG